MGNTFFFPWEIDFMVFLQQNMGSLGIFISKFFTYLGSNAILIGVLCLTYWCIDKDFLKNNSIGIMTGLVVSPIIKGIYIRRRPYFDSDVIKNLVPVDSTADIYDIKAQGYSFPSMHTTNSLTIYVGLSRNYTNKVIRIMGIVIPVLVGISRVATGNHYPTDVIVGGLIGIFSLLMGKYLNKIKNTKYVYLVLLGIFLSGCFISTNNDFYTCYGLCIGTFLGIYLSEKIKWENAKSIKTAILRIIFGLAITLAGLGIFKLPLFTFIYPNLIFRIFRYFVISICAVYITPLVFSKVSFLK